MNTAKDIVLMRLIAILFGSTFLVFNTNTAFGQERRNFYLFPVEIEDVEEEILKIPHDSFFCKNYDSKES